MEPDRAEAALIRRDTTDKMCKLARVPWSPPKRDAAIRRAGKPIALYKVVLKANAVATQTVLP